MPQGGDHLHIRAALSSSLINSLSDSLHRSSGHIYEEPWRPPGCETNDTSRIHFISNYTPQYQHTNFIELNCTKVRTWTAGHRLNSTAFLNPLIQRTCKRSETRHDKRHMMPYFLTSHTPESLRGTMHSISHPMLHDPPPTSFASSIILYAPPSSIPINANAQYHAPLR